MAEITAAMVKELREKTDAPMMECKKALSEAGGDMAKAEEILRVKLGSKASKAASRVTAEGIVSIHVEGAHAAMVEINCETDFVAKNDDFLAFSGDVARLVCAGGVADVAGLSAASLSGGTVESVRTALVGKIGENISVRRFTRLAAKGKLFSYIHSGAKIGVLVDLVGAMNSWAEIWRCTLPPQSPSRWMPLAWMRPSLRPSVGLQRRRLLSRVSPQTSLPKWLKVPCRNS